MKENILYYGDNLTVLREHFPDESVDLIYLDPPFNSNASYNVLFKSPEGHESHAQIEAFEDSWHWGDQAEREFQEILHQSNTDVAEMIQALRRFLRENDMMAYLVMMANRLLELHRVLKPTGSLYLHCDPTASHYLKVVLDSVFGTQNFKSEIIWKRTSAHSNIYRSYGDVTDTILFYQKTNKHTWNQIYTKTEEKEIERLFPKTDPDGRRWRSENMRNPGVRPNLTYDYKAGNGIIYHPHPNGWTVRIDKMKQLEKEGRLHFPQKPSGRLRLKYFADEWPGIKLQNLWDDISPISSQAAERLGYPTQKPLALLERIIQVSSDEGDLVLDPFCGCGTAVHAAHKLNRHWIGIDITHLAIALVEKRLKDAFTGIVVDVDGAPKDLEGAQDLADRDKYQFQWWACSRVNAQPYKGKKKGADSGIDGLIFFQDEAKLSKKAIVSVKGGKSVTVTMIRDLISVVDREKAQIGLFVTLAPPTKAMLKEAAAAGFYESPEIGKSFPKIQILTIEGLLSGKEQALYPDLTRGGLTFKKAKKDKQTKDQKELFK